VTAKMQKTQPLQVCFVQDFISNLGFVSKMEENNNGTEYKKNSNNVLYFQNTSNIE
jgi:hypothetical protein